MHDYLSYACRNFPAAASEVRTQLGQENSNQPLANKLLLLLLSYYDALLPAVLLLKDSPADLLPCTAMPTTNNPEQLDTPVSP